jgi:hypothetical protein
MTRGGAEEFQGAENHLAEKALLSGYGDALFDHRSRLFRVAD